MFDDTGRRRFLQLAGTGTAASLAGCSSYASHEGDVESATVTLQVRPDEESLQQLQEEIRSQVQSGELDRAQASATFRRRRAQLVSSAVDSLRNRTANNETLSMTVDEALPRVGAMLVTGEPATLIRLLSFDEVAGIFPASAFDRARQASSGGGGGGGGGADPTPTG